MCIATFHFISFIFLLFLSSFFTYSMSCCLLGLSTFLAIILWPCIQMMFFFLLLLYWSGKKVFVRTVNYENHKNRHNISNSSIKSLEIHSHIHIFTQAMETVCTVEKSSYHTFVITKNGVGQNKFAWDKLVQNSKRFKHQNDESMFSRLKFMPIEWLTRKLMLQL